MVGCGSVAKKPDSRIFNAANAGNGKIGIFSSLMFKVSSSSLRKHVLSISDISDRVAYSEDTTGISKAYNYILLTLKQAGFSQTTNPRQKGYFTQGFTMQHVNHTDQSLKSLGGFDLQKYFLPESINYKFVVSKPQKTRFEDIKKSISEGLSLIGVTYSEKAIYTMVIDEMSKAPVLDNLVEAGNVIVKIPGRKNPNKKVIIGAHYDARDGNGANDNATGVSALLEIASILSNVTFENTIEIVFFTAEEELPRGSLGSRFYAEEIKKNNEQNNVIGVFIVDMIGNNISPKEPGGPESLDLQYDKNNPSISKKIIADTKKAINNYLPSLSINVAPDLSFDSDDDHFQKMKIPTIFFAEDTGKELEAENIYFNTPDDLPKHIDFDGFFPEAVKAILISVANTAIPCNKSERCLGKAKCHFGSAQ